jgi:hypothetical protein
MQRGFAVRQRFSNKNVKHFSTESRARSRGRQKAVVCEVAGGYRYGATPLSRSLICFDQAGAGISTLLREPTKAHDVRTDSGTRARRVDGTGGPDQPKAPGMFPCREPTPGPCPAAGRTSQKPRKPRKPRVSFFLSQAPKRVGCVV